jgi:membrane associated rhomboid family serine protease
MFPYRDENETQRAAIVTGAIIALNVAAWIFVQGAGSTLALARSVCDLGLVPGELTLSVPPGTAFPMGERLVCLTDPDRQISHLFTSMFLHGSWMHLLGNMWFLWIFGNNIEDSVGRLRFIAFYLLSGLAAALGQVITGPSSVIPMVGASGAISGVMGGYLILFPNVRVFAMVPIGFILTSVALPAWVMLGYWFLIQVCQRCCNRWQRDWRRRFAHIRRLVAGVVLIKPFVRKDYLEARRSHTGGAGASCSIDLVAESKFLGVPGNSSIFTDIVYFCISTRIGDHELPAAILVVSKAKHANDSDSVTSECFIVVDWDSLSHLSPLDGSGSSPDSPVVSRAEHRLKLDGMTDFFIGRSI